MNPINAHRDSGRRGWKATDADLNRIRIPQRKMAQIPKTKACGRGFDSVRIRARFMRKLQTGDQVALAANSGISTAALAAAAAGFSTFSFFFSLRRTDLPTRSRR